MKKIAMLSVACLAMAFMTSAMRGDSVITRNGRTAIINTTTITRSVKGYRGPTPLKIYVKGNKITKIEPLRNRETPKFFARAKKVLSKFVGKSVSKAAKMQVDAKTGATFSTKALIKNVQMGAKYYKKNK